MPNVNRQPSLFIIRFDGGDVPSRDESRILVGIILTEYLGDGQAATLQFDEFGKPHVLEAKELAVSYAHSKSCLVVAIHPTAKAVGVDTESTTRLGEILELKQSAFSTSEIRAMKEKDYVFAWCTKEAAVKQLGKGFREADPLRFSVKITDKSYKLDLDENEVLNGYLLKVLIDDNVIVVCADQPFEDFTLHERSLNNLKVKE